jgi:diketogulonate reductase-like aldo/keto reductase
LINNKKIQIHKTNLNVYPIGQGTLFGRSLEGSTRIDLIKKKIEVLKYGIEIGMNFIDTGEDYEGGTSEELLSEVVKYNRDKIIIGSKFKPSNNGYENVIQSLESSLKRIKTDYIDIYQIQWPNPNIPIEDTLSALNKLIEQGKIRYIGVGNFAINQLKEALSFDEFNKLCVLQTEYDLFNRSIEDGILDFNYLKGITTIAYMSFGKNLFSNDEKRFLENLSEKYSKSIRSIVLNWIVSHKNVLLLTSSMSKKNTYENFCSLDFSIEKKDIDLINQKFIRETLKILPSKIKVIDFDESDTAHQIYTTVEQAISNNLGIKPSASELAEEIKKTGKLLRPIELKHNPDKSSNKPYILVRGRMRFWGWIIAYGDDLEIECKLF